ncbi:50S ribosomal protein L18e [Patescibacteria group bacterium]|nr:50S ribosomal protein L18e [Patescibacteria group bacterium]
MKSKTKIDRQLKKKTNENLVETIKNAKRYPEWIQVASMLASPRKNFINLNLDEIDKASKEGESVVICGKVLSQGEIKKKIKIIAFNFSESSKEKLLKLKVPTLSIIEEIKQNPEARDIKVLKKIK